MSASPSLLDHPAPARHSVSMGLLLFGLAAAPLAWIVQTSLNYLVASRACYPFDARQLHVVVDGLWSVLIIATVLALAIGVAAAMASWAAWRATRSEYPGGGEEAIQAAQGRTCFLALCGIMISGLFVAAVIFNAVGLFVVPPCG
jgi:hypothetical protein